jgi:hypothetical protein
MWRQLADGSVEVGISDRVACAGRPGVSSCEVGVAAAGEACAVVES